MSIKLAIRIEYIGAAINIGASVEVVTHVIEIENERLERLLAPNKFVIKTISVVDDET